MRRWDVAVLGFLVVSMLGALPLACLFSPLDYSGTAGGGAGGSSTTNGTMSTGIAGSGGTACDPDECPDPAMDCRKKECIDNKCGIVKLLSGPCGADGNSQCNADGNCMCTKAEQCSANDCQTPKCNDGICEPDSKPQGTECNLGEGKGKCDGAGSCKKDVGQSCNNKDDCFNGHCVNGYCCNSECTAHCTRCAMSLTGEKNGECSAALPGTPDNDDADPDCSMEGGCGENGLCACSDNALTMGETDIDCGGICGSTCTIGRACSIKSDCAEDRDCVDGVCCNASLFDCSGLCKSCNQEGLEGICSSLPPGSKPDGCMGINACGKDGTCELDLAQSCGSASGACATNYCVAVCSICLDGLCPTGEHCIQQREGIDFCSPYQPLGGSCFTDEMCKSGPGNGGADLHCVDGVCCNSPCTGTCEACHMDYTGTTTGVCAPIKLGYDPQGECDAPTEAASCNGAKACQP